MKPYSKDLRLKILAACDRGMPRKEVSRIFGVSEPTIRACFVESRVRVVVYAFVNEKDLYYRPLR